MRHFVIAAVLMIGVLGVPAFGAGPASRPLTPAQQIEALKAEISKLQAENEELRARLAKAEDKGADAKAAEQPIPFKPGALARKGRLVAENLGVFKDKNTKDSLAHAADHDKLIAAYVAAHPLSEKVISALNEGRPGAGMTRELLDLVGHFKMQSETPDGEDGLVYVYGPSDVEWSISIRKGVVTYVGGPNGRGNEWSSY